MTQELAAEVTAEITVDRLAQLVPEINDHHFEGEGHHEKAMLSFRESGRRLHEAKALVKHGEWKKWIDENCVFDIRTAQNYMRLHEKWNEFGANAKSLSHFLDMMRNAEGYLPDATFEADAPAEQTDHDQQEQQPEEIVLPRKIAPVRVVFECGIYRVETNRKTPPEEKIEAIEQIVSNLFQAAYEHYPLGIYEKCPHEPGDAWKDRQHWRRLSGARKMRERLRARLMRFNPEMGETLFPDVPPDATTETETPA